METGYICPAGKGEWPELVGKPMCQAKQTIESENGEVNVVFHYVGIPVPINFLCDRVYVKFDKGGKVAAVPRIG